MFPQGPKSPVQSPGLLHTTLAAKTGDLLKRVHLRILPQRSQHLMPIEACTLSKWAFLF